MKVFISWSGELSHKIACAVREWLPSVIQAIRPYVSSQDIDKGARWSSDIAKELEASSFGIICVTGENLESAWINFEAGALSRSMDKSHVSPLLFGVKRSEVQGPLLQFQSTIVEKDDVYKLVKSINARLEAKEQLRDEQLEKAFDIWWPELSRALQSIKTETDKELPNAKAEKVPGARILEELLELARQQQRILSSPERVLPPEYLEVMLRRSSPERIHRRHYSARLHSRIVELEESVVKLCARFPEATEARDILSSVHAMAHDELEDIDLSRQRARDRARLLGDDIKL